MASKANSLPIPKLMGIPTDKLTPGYYHYIVIIRTRFTETTYLDGKKLKKRIKLDRSAFNFKLNFKNTFTYPGIWFNVDKQ